MPPSVPTATFTDEFYLFQWEPEQVTVTFDGLFEKRNGGGTWCEITIESAAPPAPGVLYGPKNFNLSTSSTALANDLSELRPDVDWRGLLTQVSGIGIKRWREGDPLLDLSTVTPASGSLWLLPGFIEARGATVLAAAGGAGKSTLALGACLAVATGLPVLGMTPLRQCVAAYLDWEADAETHQERLQALWHGMGRSGDVPPMLVYYKRQVASMMDSARTLRRQLAADGVGFAVVDSAGYARGGGVADDEATNRMYLAIRSLDMPVLVVDHLNRSTIMNPNQPALPIGSVYSTNAPRRVWTMRSVETGSGLSIGLRDEKRNNGRQQPSLGFDLRFEMEGDTILSASYTPTSPLDLPATTQPGRKYQIATAIREMGGEPMGVDEIARATDLSEANVRAVLNQNSEWFVNVGTRRDARWALLSTHEVA